jgi:hypothetical protein
MSKGNGVVSLTQGRGPDLARKVRLTKTGAEFADDLTFDECMKIGADLLQIPDSCPWWVGDYLNMVERKHGEKYAQLVSEKSAKTLMNLASVASRFENSRRREILSFAHHAEVAYMEPAEQDILLAKAEENDWTRAQLREAKKQYKRLLADPDATLPPKKGREVVMTGVKTTQPAAEDDVHPDGTREELEAVDDQVEIDRLNEEIAHLHDLVEALSADDKAAEIKKLVAHVQALEGRLRGESNKAREAINQAKWQGRILANLRKLLRCETNKEIQARVLALIQTG